MPKKVRATKKLTRREQRDLDIEIAFLEGVVRREPAYVEALQILGDDYTLRGRFDDVLRIDQQLARLRPDEPLVLYNLACSYALADQIEQALSVLTEAIERGYDDFSWLSKDPDLRIVRKHKLYKQIQDKIQSGQVKIQ